MGFIFFYFHLASIAYAEVQEPLHVDAAHRIEVDRERGAQASVIHRRQQLVNVVLLELKPVLVTPPHLRNRVSVFEFSHVCPEPVLVK